MSRLCLLIAGLLPSLLSLAAPASAQRSPVLVQTEDVRICPAAATETLPDFTAPDCETTDLWSLDPQGRHIWVELGLDLAPADLAGPGPYGLQVVAKASSLAWINGTAIGANGHPASTAGDEVPGRMDAVFFVPRDAVHEGINSVVLRMSSQHGAVRLAGPVHFIAFGPYHDPARRMISAYWPSLITFGAFVMGALFFGGMAWRGEDSEGSGLLSALSLFAAMQLLAEVSRSLHPYLYPVHELRLIAILVCAYGFGLCLNAYLLLRLADLERRGRLAVLAVIALAMATAIAGAPGFDGKTGYTLLFAALSGLVTSGYGAWRGKPGGWVYLAVLGGYAALLLAYPQLFLDNFFYFAAAAVLAWLVYRQALTLAQERRRRRQESMRAQRLETALAQARQKTDPARLQLVSSGRVDYVATDHIVQLQGAGDYVEVHFDDGRTALYNGSLAGLEAELPETFLRVHRSHIVNTGYVGALEREASGVGRLLLSNGTCVPVSRRIMPKVRSALAVTAD